RALPALRHRLRPRTRLGQVLRGRQYAGADLVLPVWLRALLWRAGGRPEPLRLRDGRRQRPVSRQYCPRQLRRTDRDERRVLLHARLHGIRRQQQAGELQQQWRRMVGRRRWRRWRRRRWKQRIWIGDMGGKTVGVILMLVGVVIFLVVVLFIGSGLASHQV